MAATPGDSPLLTLGEMTFVASRGDNNEVVVRATEAVFETKSDLAHLSGVHAIVRSPGDKRAFEIRCDEGDLDLGTNDLRARGNVHGTTQNGQEFSTDWVSYDHARGLLFTRAPVVIHDGSGTFRGGGFEYLVDERRFRLTGGATVVHEP